MADLIEECTQLDFSQRPSMQELIPQLKQMHSMVLRSASNSSGRGYAKLRQYFYIIITCVYPFTCVHWVPTCVGFHGPKRCCTTNTRPIVYVRLTEHTRTITPSPSLPSNTSQAVCMEQIARAIQHLPCTSRLLTCPAPGLRLRSEGRMGLFCALQRILQY